MENYRYFDNDRYYMTNHHLDSFNDYILNKIPKHLRKITLKLYILVDMKLQKL